MDREEAACLVERYGTMVYRLAYARTGSREDAEDITQETFLKLVWAAPAFREEEHCKAWLLRVAANCAGDLHRSPWRRRVVPLEEAGEMTTPEWEAGDMGEVLSALPEDYRVVVHLYYYEDMSTAEIARVLGKREGSIRTRLSRARKMLRQILSETEGDAYV